MDQPKYRVTRSLLAISVASFLSVTPPVHAQQLSVIAQTGQLIDTGTQSVPIDSLYVTGSTAITAPIISSSGSVAFEAQLHGYFHYPDGYSGAAFQNSILLASPQNQIQPIALPDIPLGDTNGQPTARTTKMPKVISFLPNGTILMRHLFEPTPGNSAITWGYWNWSPQASRKMFSLDESAPTDPTALMTLPSDNELQAAPRAAGCAATCATSLSGPFCTLRNSYALVGMGDSGPLKMIARQGEAAAGTSGTYNQLSPKSDAQGNVLISGNILTSEFGSEPALSNCMWYARASDISHPNLLLRAGATAPGTSAGNIFRSLHGLNGGPTGNAQFNNAQRIAFLADFGTASVSNGTGVWVATAPTSGAAISPEAAIITGQSIQDGSQTYTVASIANLSFAFPATNQSFYLTDGAQEQVLAWVRLSGSGIVAGSNDLALVSSERAAQSGMPRVKRVIFRAGTSIANAPGVNLSQLDIGKFISVSRNGDVAAWVRLSGAVTPDSDSGLLVSPRGSSGAVRIVLREGDAAPGNATHQIKENWVWGNGTVINPQITINTRGQVVLQGFAQPLGSSPYTNPALFAVNQSGVATSLAITGETIHLANGQSLSRVDNFSFSPRGLNDAGDLVFGVRHIDPVLSQSKVAIVRTNLTTGTSCIAEADGSPGITSGDLFAYLDSWFGRDGAVSDLIAYVTAWLLGC